MRAGIQPDHVIDSIDPSKAYIIKMIHAIPILANHKHGYGRPNTAGAKTVGSLQRLLRSTAAWSQTVLRCHHPMRLGSSS